MTLSANVKHARRMVHAAIQLPCRAALSNLPQQANNGQANLEWTDGAFRTRALRDGSSVELLLRPLTLRIGNEAIGLNGVTYDAALDWLDQRLVEHGHQKASRSRVDFDLPTEICSVSMFAETDDLAMLGRWYSLAAIALKSISASCEGSLFCSSDIRCWSKHLNIAADVNLRQTRKPDVTSVAIGLSSGDEHYDQPYIFAVPTPVPDRFSPEQIELSHWHSNGFKGFVATGEKLIETRCPGSAMQAFFEHCLDEATVLLNA